MRYEIRDRDGQWNLDGSAPSRPFMSLDPGLSLVDVLRIAVKLGRTVDVWADDRYVVTYCGACPHWWLPGTTGEHMHEVSSLGWCGDCLDAGLGYIHHLAPADEIAVLTETAITDRVLRRQVEADGQTAAEYAREHAGQDHAKPDYDCLAARIEQGGVFLGPSGLMRRYTVHMKDLRTVITVAVPYDNAEKWQGSGPADFWEARDLAERLAYDRPGRPRRCSDCRGTKGHAKDCYVTRDIEFYTSRPEFAREFFAEHPEHLANYPELAAALAEEE